MRTIIISFCFLLAALSVKAQSISGIRIDGGDTPVLVYFGGNQMCSPTTTCFVANLNAGYYTVEIYASRYSRPGERVWKGQRLYNQRVYFSGSGVKDIFVDNRPGNNVRPERPGQEDRYPEYDRFDRVMSDRLFRQFLEDLKKEPFDQNRTTLITTALANSDFTSGQCLQIVETFTFDDGKMKVMKLMYPRIVDKQAFFTVLATLTFSSSKDAMNKFIREYNN